MNRAYTLAIGIIVALVIGFVAGTSVSTGGAKPVDEQKPDSAKLAGSQKTAVFNMAAVMHDFNQAKYQVYQLTVRKVELSKSLEEMREEYKDIAESLRANPTQPQKEAKEEKLRKLKRKIEDEDEKISKKLNDEASAIISDLYDKVKAVVDRTAEEEGFQLVFTYPDAATPAEMNNTYLKELKLKPPAAQPFYVAKDADITATVVTSLNKKYPPIDPKTKKPVDVSKLTFPGMPGTPAPDTKPRGPVTPGTIPMALPPLR